MNSITIKAETLEYALNILNLQYDHIRKEKKGIPQNRQDAYYHGMYTMLELLVNQAFSDNTYQLYHNCWHEHFIKQNNA